MILRQSFNGSSVIDCGTRGLCGQMLAWSERVTTLCCMHYFCSRGKGGLCILPLELADTCSPVDRAEQSVPD